MVIGETKAELRDTHDKHMNLRRVAKIVFDGLGKVKSDLNRLKRWEHRIIDETNLKPWVNKRVTDTWGKKAACRVFHICASGHDVEMADPFAPGEATEKPVVEKQKIPGHRIRQRSFFTMLVKRCTSVLALTDRKSNRGAQEEWRPNIPSLGLNL